MTQVQIVVASIAFHNYMRRKFVKDVAFNEFECHPNFMPQDVLRDVPQSQTYKDNKTSHMNYVRDGIASNLMRELQDF